MDIATRVEFATDPESAFAMLTDRSFLEQVCTASGAISYDVSSGGVSSRMSRTLPAPASAAKLTGPTLTLNESVDWGAANGDGSRTASVTMTVLGQPVTLRGTLRLIAGGRGSLLELTGVLKVAIPLIGRKLEASAAPAVLDGFQIQQEVADRWLS